MVGRGAQRRRLALLAHLAAHRHRPVSREKLLGYFWPERPSAEGRHALAQAIYSIRHDFGERVLVSGPDDLRTDPAGVSADVIDFLDALDRGDLEAAVAAYTGPFLDGFYVDEAPEFERWVDATRGLLAQRCSVALETLAQNATAAGRFAEAVSWWQQRAALDPLDARVTIQLMEALAAAGDFVSALRQAAIYEGRVQQELDAPPNPRVHACAERIRRLASPPVVAAGSPTTPAPHGASAPAPAPAPAPSVVEPARPHRVMPVALGLMLLFGVIAIATRIHRQPTPVAPPRLVVLGSIEGPDSTLNLAVHEALRSGLEADATIQVLGETRIHETLRLMARSPETALDGSIASEVALRRGAELAVVGTAVPVGTEIQIVVRALTPGSGEALLTLSEHAEMNAVMPALVRIREAVRRKVLGTGGDAPFAPLPPVMTSSLPALRDYALARDALRHSDRDRALHLAEAALGEDSMFPMANYLVGDLDWFADRQREAEAHLARARAQADRLPLKERLLVEARYQEVVADRSDSALRIWEQARDAFPDDGLAYDGMTWTLRALGRFGEAAAAARKALALDSTTFAASAGNAVHALLESGDTAGARTFVREHRSAMRDLLGFQVEFYSALRATDWPRALAVLPPGGGAEFDPYRQVALLVNGRFSEAATTLGRIRLAQPHHQFLPRAISLQARAEVAAGARSPESHGAAREVLTWLNAADLSSAATARLAERTAELALRLGDPGTVLATRQLLVRRDAGRHLPSIRLALRMVDAALAFGRKDYRSAAALAREARAGTFHGRSPALAALLEADSYAALGDSAAASAFYQRLLGPGDFAQGDIETWAVLHREIGAKLLQLGRTAVRSAGSAATVGQKEDSLPRRAGQAI